MAKNKLLVVSDAAVAPTGFGRVAEAILDRLYATGRWDIKQMGINFFDTDHDKPYRIFTAAGPGNPGDWTGYARVNPLRKEINPDVVWLFQDVWHISEYISRLEDRTSLVTYFPIDAPNIKPAWVMPHAIACEVATYTRFGAEEFANSARTATDSIISKATLSGVDRVKMVNLTLRDGETLDIPFSRLQDLSNPDNIRVIPHGLDPTLFYQTDKIAARRKLGLPEDAFIVGNVNRNQPRKRLDLTIAGFAEFARDRPDAFLLLHETLSTPEGWDLAQLAEYYGVKDRVLISSTRHTVETLNDLYNTFDVSVNTGGGEGWGLCLGPDSQVATPEGPRKIKDVQVGDMVADRYGVPQRVLGTVSRAVESYYEVGVLGRHPIKVTEEHPFLTPEGWRNVRSLKAGDLVALGTVRREYLGSEPESFPDPDTFEDYLGEFRGQPLRLDFNLAYVLGAFYVNSQALSDGTRGIGCLEDGLAELAICTSRVFGKETAIVSREHASATDRALGWDSWVTPGSEEAWGYLDSVTHQGIPSEIFCSENPHVLTGFLYGMFSEGVNHVELRGPHAETDALKVQMMLDGMGWWSEVAIEEDISWVGWDPEDPRVVIVDGLVCSPVEDIFEVKSPLQVYDLSVENTHSFVANGVVVHNTTFESASCRTPQIVPNWSATKEIWEGTAMLTDVAGVRHMDSKINLAHCQIDTEHFAEQLTTLYENPDECRRIGEACYQKAMDDTYNWDAIAEQVEETLVRAMEQKTPNKREVDLR